MPATLLDEVLAAAIRAPTAGSMQLYSVIASVEPSRREVLAAIHFGAESLRQAPVVFTFCIDIHRVSAFVALGGETPGFGNGWGFAIGFTDTVAAAQNAALAAESLGLGTCFLGSTIAACPTLCRFLACPSGVLPVLTLLVGYPAETPAPTSRLPVAAVVHRETYRVPSPEQVREYYAQHAVTTFDMFATMPVYAGAVAAFGVDNLASLYARLSYPGDLLELSGAYFGAALAEQGFTSDAQAARAGAVRAASAEPLVTALPVVRQLVFSLAIASGQLDGKLAKGSTKLEGDLHAFLNVEDPTLYDDFAAGSVFHPGHRARLAAALGKYAAIA